MLVGSKLRPPMSVSVCTRYRSRTENAGTAVLSCGDPHKKQAERVVRPSVSQTIFKLTCYLVKPRQ